MITACPACNHSNPGDNRFCGMCGARLERRRTPDSELLPEDAEHSGPAAEIPAARADSGPARHQRTLNWEQSATPRPTAKNEQKPIGEPQQNEAPRAATPPSASSPELPVSEPPVAELPA